MSRRVLMLLTNPFRPDPRVHKEAKALMAAGHEVTVLAWDRGMDSRPAEAVDGIKIERYGPPSVYSSALSHIINLPRFWLNIFRAGIRRNADVVHAHDLDTLPAGVLLSWLKGIPLVYDAHESYSRMISGTSPNPLIIDSIDSLERQLARKAEFIITVNQKLARILGRSGRRVEVIMNCPPLPPEASISGENIRKELGLENELVVLYIGVLERGRFLVEAASAMDDLDGDIHMVIGGFGTLEPRIRRMASRSENITFLGRVPSEKVMEYTGAADAILCMFDPGDLNNRLGTPNKLFESMAAGKPIILAEGTLGARIGTESGNGIAVPYSVQGFRKAVEALLAQPEKPSQMGRKGRYAAVRKYNWENMAKRLVKAYSRL